MFVHKQELKLLLVMHCSHGTVKIFARIGKNLKYGVWIPVLSVTVYVRLWSEKENKMIEICVNPLEIVWRMVLKVFNFKSYNRLWLSAWSKMEPTAGILLILSVSIEIATHTFM